MSINNLPIKEPLWLKVAAGILAGCALLIVVAVYVPIGLVRAVIEYTDDL